MKRPLAVSALFLLVAVLAAVRTVTATPPLERRAKAAGFPAADCTYCHSFGMDHMNQKALELRIPPNNCYACHGNRLPRTGQALYNGRGQYLLDQKRARRVDAVDIAWLKDYVEASATPANAKR